MNCNQQSLLAVSKYSKSRDELLTNELSVRAKSANQHRARLLVQLTRLTRLVINNDSVKSVCPMTGSLHNSGRISAVCNTKKYPIVFTAQLEMYTVTSKKLVEFKDSEFL